MSYKNAESAHAPFAVVGIGASAGGLAALEQFLSNVPVNSGMAYVIVQHAAAHRKGMLVELLQRRTVMPTVEAKDQMQAESDHVYVIPPGHDLSILHGVLHLLDTAEPHGLRLPIDFFFKSLADDAQQKSIGVILSGMGSDGTQGLRAIRLAAGACFVQRPDDAQFDNMPRSAIDAGVADVIAPANELPQKILDYVNRVQHGLPVEIKTESDPRDPGFLDKVILLMRTQSGHDFSLYKKSTIARRVERRMGLHQLSRANDYLRYLRENPKESEVLFSELLIGVTSFFRDAMVWEQLKTKVIPALLASHPAGADLRAWAPGCSTGEEAFSLAIVFKEAIEEAASTQKFSLQIFASDLDKESVAIGRAGVYPQSVAHDVSEQRLNRFFVVDPGGYRVCDEIRETVVFAEQNIIVAPPFIKIDILSCRNLLIYFEPELQSKLLQLFHYSLNPGGYLVLGSAESVGAVGKLFSPLNEDLRIFRRLETSTRLLPVDFPAAFVRVNTQQGRAELVPSDDLPDPPNLELLVEKLVLQRYAPAAVLVSAQGETRYFCGNTGKYLEPPAGKPNWDLIAMARDGLKQGLSEVFYRAAREKTLSTLKKIKVVWNDGKQYVDILVQPLSEPAALAGMLLVVFYDVDAPRRKKIYNPVTVAAEESAHIEALEQDLQHAREEARSTREEMQTSQEELKSTNEELQSTIEELQSTNEELTTSKEEIQSMNEELQTINHELQAKVNELSRANNDMKNLLDSTEIATLFLDESLNVRRFTPQTTRIVKLIPGDAGRPVADIVNDLIYPDMLQHARDVLRTLLFKEVDAPTVDGRWFKVRIMPYRTQDNHIDGLVITFSDITVSKKLEGELRASQSKPQASVDDSKPPAFTYGLS